MTRLEEKHPLAIRWFHWVNFPLLSLMIWSGLLIYWANDVYRIGLGNVTLLHFFFMWLFVANGAVYILYLAFSGEWRKVLPDRNALRDAVLVTLHDLHLRKEAPPQGLYNGAQRVAYTTAIAMATGCTVTGLAIYKPAQLSWLTGLPGGYPMARWEHFWLMAGFVSFFAVHIVQVIRAGWDNFRSMVAGYSLVRGEAARHEQARWRREC